MPSCPLAIPMGRHTSKEVMPVLIPTSPFSADLLVCSKYARALSTSVTSISFTLAPRRDIIVISLDNSLRALADSLLFTRFAARLKELRRDSSKYAFRSLSTWYTVGPESTGSKSLNLVTRRSESGIWRVWS